MRRWKVVAVAVALGLCASAAAGVRDRQWREVQEALSKGLPKTAAAVLDSIGRDALRARDYPEAARAIVGHIAVESAIQGHKPEERILALQARMAGTPAAMRPVLEAILARWYWQYFQENRWRFVQRSATADSPSDDFRTWDLPRIYAEIDRHFARALADPEPLQRAPIARWSALLTDANVPDAYRPTLYDFIAFEAIGFYASGEQAGAQPQDAFEIAADGPIFDAAEAFVRWKPATADSTSAKLRAILLFQDLLRFHARDGDPAARIDADLERLRFGGNYAVGPAKDARRQAALQRVAERESRHEASAVARAEWAEMVLAAGDAVAARRIARLGAERFPESPGGRACYNLIQRVESRTLAIQTERVWGTPAPSIDIHYRNLERVHFRLVAVDYEKWIASGQGDLRSLQPRDLDSLLALPPARAWSVDVPGTPDLRQRLERVPSARGLRSGMYILLASDSRTFERKDHPVQGTVVWVSELALVVSDQDRRRLDGLVLNANSGEPVPGARVRWWSARRPSPAGSIETDGDGRFSVPGVHGRVWLIVTRADQQLGLEDAFWEYSRSRTPFERTLFFTDRAIYRPGQTIRYKGICIRVDQEHDRYRVMPGQTVIAVLRDPNGSEVARQEHRANDYGSFSGSFTAPSGRLLGAMSLSAEEGPDGAASVRVEEYKRPKFQVTLEAPRAAPRLDDTVAVAGVATAYTGAAVDGAQVRWRVVRQVRYPPWWWWLGWREPRGAAQEIAHGTAVTASDGRFRIEFVALPDHGVSAESEPTFSYSVHASVTDLAGETRAAERAVQVGYTALRAELTADDWQVRSRPVAITVRTTSHDGVPAPATGRLVVVRPRPPERVEGAPLRGRRREPAVSDASAGDEVLSRPVATDSTGTARLEVPLPVGDYRARLETRDRFGKEVRAWLRLRVLDPDGRRCPIRLPDLLASPKWSWEPGEEFLAVWGSGYERARAYVEIEHRGRILQAYWTAPGATQAAIRQRVTEEMRGGFVLRVTMVREGRAYLHANRVEVPWTNQRLTLRWEHLVSKLGPGQRETWTAVIAGPDATRAAAEMVATLYDASLDAFAPHGWPGLSDVFRTEHAVGHRSLANGPAMLFRLAGDWRQFGKNDARRHREFRPELLWDWGRHGGALWGLLSGTPPSPGSKVVKTLEEVSVRGGVASHVERLSGAPSAEMLDALAGVSVDDPLFGGDLGATAGGPSPPSPDLARVVARRNLEETAFFFPHLVADDRGEVRMTFTMPEALTEWRFLGFAHDARLRSGSLEGRAVTAKDLMVQPNPPRFLREGDVLEFTVRVTNLSDQRQRGRVSLALTDGVTGRPADAAYGNRDPEQAFDVPPRESRTHSWRLAVPDGAEVLAYKAVASTGSLSDGEEAFLPVLSRSVLVTESLPLPIRGPATRAFDFARLRGAGASSTLRHQSLTVQMVSNPAWYGVMALPYLMEYPYECTEQTFNRLYANTLAEHVANSDPRIRQVFDRWRGTPALDSPLEKSQDLKAVVLQETPWLRQAQAESRARRDVGILFDRNRLESERQATHGRLAQAQLPDGAWPWFPGGPANDYITLYITTGFGRLRHLGATVDVAPALRALDRLDRWANDAYRKILAAGTKDGHHLTPMVALYLYGRSFFLDDRPIAGPQAEAIDYWEEQARRYWLELPSRQSQGHVALALRRFGDSETPLAILRSLRERAVVSEELGMFWRDEEHSWWWHRAPIESQAIMIEAFDEIAGDTTAVEECRVWLLKQKQTQDWKTTKATADAVYALLLRGRNLLASDALVEVSLGGVPIRPEHVEAGTGFYEHRFAGPQIAPRLANIAVRKSDRGVAWGSVHWQYLEDMDKVTAYTGTPLTLRKSLFVRRATARGPVIEAVKGALQVGDELVVRLELRVDRDMEYVHLKDYRGSGVEPVNVLSGFRMQDGLGYYEQTRDAASHFFIHYLPKGTYVFEYPVRVQHRGRYQTGFAQIQCMYAPEFNSHSQGFTLEVR